MTNFIRTSGVDQINSIRKLLWESIYTNFSNMQSLSNSINENFHPDSLDTVDFDFNDMSIYLKSRNGRFDYNEANLSMVNAYKGFVKDFGKRQQEDKGERIRRDNAPRKERFVFGNKQRRKRR